MAGRGHRPAVAGLDRDLVLAALLDLHVLSQTHGVPVAGWTPAWRYVWPRDSAFAASALARTGHLADAERILDFLARVQPGSGLFAGPLPAGRERRTGRIAAFSWTGSAGRCGRWPRWPPRLPRPDRPAFVARHRALIDRSTAAALRAMIDNRAGCRRPRPTTGRWPSADRRCRPPRCWRPGWRRRRAVRAWSSDGPRERTRPTGGRRLRTSITDRLRSGRIPAASGRPRRQRRPGRELPAAALHGARRPGRGRGLAAGGSAMARPGRRAGPWRLLAAGRHQLDQRDLDVRDDRGGAGRADAGVGLAGLAGPAPDGRRLAARRRCWPTAARPRWPRWPGPPPR